MDERTRTDSGKWIAAALIFLGVLPVCASLGWIAQGFAHTIWWVAVVLFALTAVVGR